MLASFTSSSWAFDLFLKETKAAQNASEIGDVVAPVTTGAQTCDLC